MIGKNALTATLALFLAGPLGACGRTIPYPCTTPVRIPGSRPWSPPCRRPRKSSRPGTQTGPKRRPSRRLAKNLSGLPGQAGAAAPPVPQSSALGVGFAHPASETTGAPAAGPVPQQEPPVPEKTPETTAPAPPAGPAPTQAPRPNARPNAPTTTPAVVRPPQYSPCRRSNRPRNPASGAGWDRPRPPRRPARSAAMAASGVVGVVVSAGPTRPRCRVSGGDLTGGRGEYWGGRTTAGVGGWGVWARVGRGAWVGAGPAGGAGAVVSGVFSGTGGSCWGTGPAAGCACGSDAGWAKPTPRALLWGTGGAAAPAWPGSPDRVFCKAARRASLWACLRSRALSSSWVFCKEDSTALSRESEPVLCRDKGIVRPAGTERTGQEKGQRRSQGVFSDHGERAALKLPILSSSL